jgi:hypothetical protein
MLSKLLPPGAAPHLALPALFSAFIQRLLEQMIDCPDLRRIREVYVVMSGQSASILDLVPQDIIEKLASTCNSILRDNTDHMRSLLFLAIYTLIARTQPIYPGNLLSPLLKAHSNLPLLKICKEAQASSLLAIELPRQYPLRQCGC